MKRISLIALLLISINIIACNASEMSIAKLTCEMAENPVVISTLKPVFGWELNSERQGDFQTAYKLFVASEEALLSGSKADIWISDKVKSNQSQLVKYDGKTLTPGKKYYWRVEVWDAKKRKVKSDKIGCFRLAPDAEKFNADWIGAITKANSNLPKGRKWHVPSAKGKSGSVVFNAIDTLALKSIQLRKDFKVDKKVSEAMLYISGLGHYILNLNGKRVGNSEFDPLWSDYDKTVYYSAYDVKELLVGGGNAVGVMLGNGFYNTVSNRYAKLWVSFGPPTLLMQLQIVFEDGTKQTIKTDNTWKYSLSPVTFNDIFGGESYDATLEQNGWDVFGFNENANWMPVVLQEAPSGKLRPQTAPSVKVMTSYNPKKVNRISDGCYLLDMGQNLSGFPTIKVKGKRGDKIKLTVGELLTKDGLVNQRSSGGPYYFEYTLKGEGEETWTPCFSYYGFQYIQIDGADLYKKESEAALPVITDIKSLFVHNSSERTGSFTSSNEIFNKAHDIIHYAVKSNFTGVFTDCPHREKLGWLEETHLNGHVLLYNYNLTSFIPKIVQDMKDAQYENGLVPSIAPEYVVFGGDFSDSPEWGIASIMVPWLYYEFYGDNRLIEQAYDMMKKYVDYLGTKADNGILDHGLGDWYDYGTHAAGYAKNSPISISATSHYYMAISYLVKSAEMLGKDVDAEVYKKLMIYVRKAYNDKFFNKETAQYATGSQFSNAVSIFLDLVEEEYRPKVLANLVADIKARGNRLTTGDVGNKYLFQTLAANGLNELMYEMNNHYEAPGYGYQIKYGVTTLTEQWDPKRGNSWNHFMMGQIDEWFFKSLAGIEADMTNPGFKHFYVKPVVLKDMTHVKANHKSLYGNISVDWTMKDNIFTLYVNVPVNTNATVKMPFTTDVIYLNGKKCKIADNEICLKSGNYNLTYTINP